MEEGTMRERNKGGDLYNSDDRENWHFVWKEFQMV